MENLRLNAQKLLLSVRELWKLSDFFSEKSFQYDPIDTAKAVFTTLPKSFRQRAESFSLTCENGKNTYNFFEKK